MGEGIIWNGFKSKLISICLAENRGRMWVLPSKHRSSSPATNTSFHLIATINSKFKLFVVNPKITDMLCTR